MKKTATVSSRICFVVIFFCALTILAAPALDVARIDHDRILNEASNALMLSPITITKYRAKLSEGGPNDYYSNADYFWPNPMTTNGLPYVNHDGMSNPGNFNKHRECLRTLDRAVAALGAAYKITGDNRYVTKAVELLRVFFLDPSTRMNPNLQFAQAVPGLTPGRSYGIIDTLHMIEIPRGIEAMEKSSAFPPEVLAGLKQWFSNYVTWMRNSRNGVEESNALNNHAVAYWLQVAVFAEFTGDQSNLEECREHFKDAFVLKQMALDGSFPRELSRTKPYGYSTFQLDNMTTLCQILSTPRDNLWQFTLPDGRGIRKAVQFMYPYWADKRKWLADGHHKDIQAWDGWPAREPTLFFAGLAFGDQKYLDLWKKLCADPIDDEVRRNLAISQPILWVQPGQ
jgi:hypothetical protein